MTQEERKRQSDLKPQLEWEIQMEPREQMELGERPVSGEQPETKQRLHTKQPLAWPDKIKEIIDASEFVLVGIGEEFGEKEENRETVLKAYDQLETMIRKKTYFVVTLNEDELIFQSKLLDFFIVSPFAGEDRVRTEEAQVQAGEGQKQVGEGQKQARGDQARNGKQRMQAGEEQWNAYLNWLTATLGHKLCILELGVGFSMPQVIRWPFEKTAQLNFKSTLVRINGTFPQLPGELKDRGISVACDAVDFCLETAAGSQSLQSK